MAHKEQNSMSSKMNNLEQLLQNHDQLYPRLTLVGRATYKAFVKHAFMSAVKTNAFPCL